ncbi:MAG: hypothetical protein JO345_21820 [Streptosporangiaceae bacterium]|nr:hypothetical protein [Streptosporangiaceae bacterium]
MRLPDHYVYEFYPAEAAEMDDATLAFTHRANLKHAPQLAPVTAAELARRGLEIADQPPPKRDKRRRRA